ncbi:MAG: 3-hydroxyacyl-CoA dehydrogenase NAD-binding domain-containing protein, partial [Planctomycetes bacterium]|nr:3-hydroxyacyl-CoA dehydrogenase NAD-binding domain-containing protein [Planctomycetota bacterium]
ASGADLLIESVPENLKLKREVLARFHPLCVRETIFTTNTSYLLPSSLAVASGRPERFAAFHFHVPVWHARAVDVMPHSKTLPEVTETLCELAWRIGQVPIRSRRENPGYVFNAMLHPLLLSALDLAVRGVADLEDIDRAWMAVTKMPVGPFGIIDEIGLDTVHGILTTWGRWLPGSQAKGAAALLQGYLDRQRLGRKSNHGFYCYPSPAFAEAR